MSWDTSDEFQLAIHGDHVRAVLLEVLRNGSTEAVLPGAISGGGITVDTAAAVRRRGTIPLVDETGQFVPGVSSDLLYPNGNEIRAWRGVDFGDDRPGSPKGIAPTGVELVPVFTGPLFENDTDDQPHGIAMSLDLYDRARFIKDARWPSQFPIGAGNRWVDAIKLAVVNRLPSSIEVSFDNWLDDPDTCPALAPGGDPNGDPLRDILKWATRLGAELFFDGLGNPVLRDVPDLSSDVVAKTYQEGQGGGLLGVKKRISLEKVYNVVVASGQGTGAAAVQAIARDDDPDSATYTGAIGERTRFYSSPLLKTTSQCKRAATGLLNRKLGGAVTLEWDARVDPSLEGGEIIRVIRPRAKVSMRTILDAFPIPFDVSSPSRMAGRQRKQTG